ncbi:MAG TPA: hypothetical protein VH227_04015 [Candidatus Udaeobacter sp.]|jgi:hypothetical protein|nr:hypothetical protein [Candidatus Udaeobacter sp.]
MQAFLHALRQPEYVHVLLNPIPVYGLLVAWIGLLISFFLKSRRAQVATLVLVLLTAGSAWPVFEFGEQAYDRVLAMSDDDGQAWLDEHEARGDKFIYVFYALAFVSAAAIVLPIRWPKSSPALALVVILLGAGALGCGTYIAYAAGKVRHREFRNAPAPPKRPEHERS